MTFNLPTWTLSPALMLFTLLYFLPDHMNYSLNEWFIGNSAIAIGIGLFYISRSIYNKFGGNQEEIID